MKQKPIVKLGVIVLLAALLGHGTISLGQIGGGTPVERVPYDLVAVPEYTPMLYIGTGGGLFSSNDDGATWLKIPGIEWAGSIAVVPSDNTIVYVGTDDNGILKAARGVSDWTPVNSGLKYLKIHDLSICANNPNLLYAIVGTEYITNELLYKTTNGGKSWRIVRTPARDVNALNYIACDPKSGLLYLGASRWDPGHGYEAHYLYTHAPDQSSWEKIDSSSLVSKGQSINIIGEFGDADESQDYIRVMKVYIGELTWLYAGTQKGRVVKSSNGGKTWTLVKESPRRGPVKALAVVAKSVSASASAARLLPPRIYVGYLYGSIFIGDEGTTGRLAPTPR